MTNGVISTSQKRDDLDLLLTTSKACTVDAINEIVGKGLITERMVRVAIGLAGPVAIPALPANAKITGYQVNVPVAYPAGATITIGDHSGSLGALAATSIVTAAGTATTIGDYSGFIYKTPIGDLSISIAGGNGSTGSATVMIRYTEQ